MSADTNKPFSVTAIAREEYVAVFMKLPPFAAVLDAHKANLSSESLPSIVMSGFWISRINVPDKYRGRGYGTALLEEFLAHMDKSQSVAFVVPSPYPDSPLSYRDLISWYNRNGFVRDSNFNGLLVRMPKKVEILEPLDDTVL